MSITDNYQPDISLGNGVTVAFSGSWKVLNSSYFRLALQSVATGIQTLLTLGADYSLVFNESGYTATLNVAPTSANYVVRYREVALDQTDPYRTSKGFQGKVIEDSFDKLTAIDQDQQDQIGRSLKFQVGSSAIGYQIEDPIDGRGLKWDTVNERVVNTTGDADQIVADAEAARDAAIVAQVASELAQSFSEAAADLSEDWATKTNGTVDGSEYSSKAYAIGGTGVTNGVGRGAAKEWATKIGSTVDGTEYSAKKYAQDALASAAAAASSAAEGLYNDVITLTFANSPYVPSNAQDGTLFRIDTSGGNVVINLSTLAVYAEDMKFGFVKVTGDANTITVNRGGSNTINGGTNIVLSTQYETHVIIGDDTTGTWIDTVQTTGIADNSVTNAKLADMANSTIKGRNTAGTGDPEDLTATQVRGILSVYTQAQVDALIAAASSMTVGAKVNTTSGTSIDITGIAATAKKITLNFKGVSTNGTSFWAVQLGDSGGIETTGYTGCANELAGGTTTINSTSNFPARINSGANAWDGSIIFTLQEAATNTWIAQGVLSCSGVSTNILIGGAKSLSATLDRIRLTTAGGTDAFDAGSINVVVES